MKGSVFEREVERRIAADEFSGTILIVQNGKAVYQRACGEASKSFHILNRMDTKYQIASVGKMFTAAAVLRLAQTGKLNLEDKLSDYLGCDWAAPEAAGQVTLEHLLTHTSGYGDYFGAAYASTYQTLYETIADFQKIARGAGLAFQPGTRWDYSNLGFLLLGVVLERVYGKPYAEAVKELVFVPAGMEESDFTLRNEPAPNRAEGYYCRNGSWRTNTVFPVACATGAGGGWSTAGDLVRFLTALQKGCLLEPRLRDAMLTPKPRLGASGYGYGLFIEPGKVCHGGNGTGANAYAGYYFETDTALAILSNYSAPAADGLVGFWEQNCR